MDEAFDRTCYESVAAEWLILTDESEDDMRTVRCFAHGTAVRLSTADLQTYVEDEIVAGEPTGLGIATAIARANMDTYWDERCGD